MNALSREYAEALIAVLLKAGASEISIERGSKHPRILYRLAGAMRYRSFPGTPSDSGAGIDKAVAELRREIGLTSRVKRVGARRQRRSISVDRAAQPLLPLPLTHQSDWHSDVARHPDLQRHHAVRLHWSWIDLWRSCMSAAGGESLL